MAEALWRISEPQHTSLVKTRLDYAPPQRASLSLIHGLLSEMVDGVALVGLVLESCGFNLEVLA